MCTLTLRELGRTRLFDRVWLLLHRTMHRDLCMVLAIETYKILTATHAPWQQMLTCKSMLRRRAWSPPHAPAPVLRLSRSREVTSHTCMPGTAAQAHSTKSQLAFTKLFTIDSMLLATATLLV